MKKLPVILLASSLLLAACGNNDSDKNSSSSNNNSSNSSNKKELNEATKKYEKYTDGQLDQFLKGTQKFVDAIHDNDMQKAKELYPKVRMYYERSEPVAEAFGDLDPKIDARLADMKEEKKADQWTGYHKIEKQLYQDNKIDSTTKKDADQLLKDAKELHAKADTLDITPKLMLQGSVDLLNEVSTSKVTGEEEIYSHTDLYDFKANIEGAQKIYELFKPTLEKKDKKLSADIQKNFDKVNKLLDKYKDGDGYKSYNEVTKKDRKALSDAVNSLGEPLSKMAVVTE
ncbi:iron uptake system component Efem/EfeO family lipoprotein [Staphylococcus caprae]|uniref:iron uptake system protein EfeO n=1 Tax=Staphylococcus caprae TaxID=29380 RepID=UPI000EB61120|nr:iron uptake system protein EfeO [Staphylococcus caprae]BBD89233.1 iron uptake system component Efem/EfeO family lipoprotein [Staphylococcus caprae]